MSARRLLLLIVPLLLFTQTASPCSCSGPGEKVTLREWAATLAKNAHLVFEGEITSVRELPPRQEFSLLRKAYVFHVMRIYRGSSPASVEIETGMGGGDCGIAFQKGVRYLLYVYETKFNTLATMLCSGTKEASNADSELRYLRGEAPAKEDLLTFKEYRELRLKRETSTVCGRIERVGKQEVKNPDLRVWYRSSDEWKKGWGWYWQARDKLVAPQRYCIEALAPGEYVFSASDHSTGEPERFVGVSGGATDLEGATKVRVEAGGMQIDGPELVLHPQIVFSVAGRLILANGNAPSRNDNLTVRFDRPEEQTNANTEDPFEPPSFAEVSENGEFLIESLLPGKYSLHAIRTVSLGADIQSEEVEQVLTLTGNVKALVIQFSGKMEKVVPGIRPAKPK